MRSTNLPAEADLLKRVTVRLIDSDEREEFDRRLEADHYLGRCALYGPSCTTTIILPPGNNNRRCTPSLRYVAELDGQYVALIAFGVAALHLKARDRWIGWSPGLRPPAPGTAARVACRLLDDGRRALSSSGPRPGQSLSALPTVGRSTPRPRTPSSSLFYSRDRRCVHSHGSRRLPGFRGCQ